MPIYEYHCQDCENDFEQFLTASEAKQFDKQYPCPLCKKDSPRLSVYLVGAKFNGQAGNSGFHDVDYPILDKAVGRSATKKWEKIHKDQAERDKVRKETGSSALTDTGSGYVATSAEKLTTRTDAFTKLKSAKPQ
jgi:putative FmdB family regulatory protein